MIDREHALPIKRQANLVGISRGIKLSFLLLVVAPAVINLVYLAFFASPQYVSEIKLIVRSAEKNDILKEGVSMLQRMVRVDAGSTHQDAQIVLSFIRSRSIIEDIGGRRELLRYYGKPSIDYFSRLRADESIEKIHKYWNKKITASIDSMSGIITVRIRGFSAEEAKEIAEKMIAHSEKIINDISGRVRKDALDRAAAEVDRAAAGLMVLRRELLDFQNKAGSIDPVLDVKSVGNLIFALTLEKVEIESKMVSLSGVIDQGSVIERQRRTQIEALNRKIDELQAILTNKASSEAISAKIYEYEQIKLRSVFAEKIYELSQREYETARKDINHQKLFVTPIIFPTSAESATFPKVFVEGGLFFVIVFIFWSIIVLVVASINDHIY